MRRFVRYATAYVFQIREWRQNISNHQGVFIGRIFFTTVRHSKSALVEMSCIGLKTKREGKYV